MTDDWDAFEARLLENPETRAAFDRLAPAFEIAQSMIALRSAAGLTQRQLAKRAGLTQPEVSRIETAQVEPTWETVSALLGAMGATVQLRVRKPDGKYARVSFEPRPRPVRRPRRKTPAAQ